MRLSYVYNVNDLINLMRQPIKFQKPMDEESLAIKNVFFYFTSNIVITDLLFLKPHKFPHPFKYH